MLRPFSILVLGLALTSGTARAEHAEGEMTGPDAGKQRPVAEPEVDKMKMGFDATGYMAKGRFLDGAYQYKDTDGAWKNAKIAILAKSDGAFGGYQNGKFVRVDYKQGDILFRDVRGNWFKAKPTDENVKSTDVLDEFNRKVFELVNNIRTRRGLPALKLSKRLMESAGRHAKRMANGLGLQHTRDNVGENIAWNQRTPEEVVQSWMNSPGHRANILSPRYRETGVAWSARQTADGRPVGGIYWGQQFL